MHKPCKEMEKTCRRLPAIPILLCLVEALFLYVPGRAQQLGLEVAPQQPVVHQEFEVSYTADREIGAIEMPHWGALTLVKELGRSRGSLMSVVDGVTTRSGTYAYRYLVRSAVDGEVTVPGTTAVVDGRTYRCEGRVVTILPDTAAGAPQCRLELDTAARTHHGGCVVRLVCDRKPDQAKPLLMVDGADTYAPFSSSSSVKDGISEYVYTYRIPPSTAKRYELAVQLSFGGKAFEMEPYLITGEYASISFGGWWLYVVAGTLLALWGAVFVRDHTVAAGRGAVVSRFSWRGYVLVVLVLLFIVFSAVFVCLLFAPGVKPFPLYLAAALMLFGSCVLVLGELRRSAVRLCLDGGTLSVTPYMGLGVTRRYDIRDFDGFTKTVLVSRGEVYEYRYLMKDGRREVRLSSFYLKNYARLCSAVGAYCADKGERPMNIWLELKELFR